MALLYISHSDETERKARILRVQQGIEENRTESSIRLTKITKELDKGKGHVFSYQDPTPNKFHSSGSTQISHPKLSLRDKEEDDTESSTSHFSANSEPVLPTGFWLGPSSGGRVSGIQGMSKAARRRPSSWKRKAFSKSSVPAIICERSLNNTQNGPSMPPSPHFVRAEILPSGYLIRPCEGGGSILHIVDHFDLEPWSVPEVLRSLYESSTLLAQRTTMAALRYLRQISQEISQPNVSGWGRRPAALRALSQRLSKGFNEAVNSFSDEGWSMLESDGIDDVTLLVNSSPTKMMVTSSLPFSNGFTSMPSAVLCAKASMLLQNVPPSILLRFLREHRQEWADNSIDAYSAAAIKAGPCSLPIPRPGSFGGQVILPLAHTIENEEFMEVIKLESLGHYQEDMMMPADVFLLQMCSGVDENAVESCAELIFAPIDASFSDDAPIIPSGFRIIPLDTKSEGVSPNRTLDLASALDVGSRTAGDSCGSRGNTKSVMTIAFQLAFEMHMQENVASMARQYVRSVIASVQRVALALSPSSHQLSGGLRPPPASPEAHTLARWISHSYRCYLGVELLKPDGTDLLKSLWHHPDALMCCSLKALPPVFTFANQAGLDMLETTLVALQDITLEKIFDNNGKKTLCSDFPQIMQQRPKSDLTFSSGPAPRERASGTGGAPSSSLSFSFCFLSCRVRSLRLARLLWVCMRSPVSFLCARFVFSGGSSCSLESGCAGVVPVLVAGSLPCLGNCSSSGDLARWFSARLELGVQEELAPSSVQFCVRPLALTGLGLLCIIVQSIPSDTGGGFLQRSLGSWFSVVTSGGGGSRGVIDRLRVTP
ncbi:hypothetical protein F2Q70_00013525 [Brassica cretica]|uniref:START domain-containing protein n=1 Tax=Brassica cretica TaxID=69181 RepID=A0A8S9M0I7_BRACR|nr:hypothetical protein F2Q70_00013525 [Brassica cretica]